GPRIGKNRIEPGPLPSLGGAAQMLPACGTLSCAAALPLPTQRSHPTANTMKRIPLPCWPPVVSSHRLFLPVVRFPLIATVLLSFLMAAPTLHAAETGALTGTVSNTATGNLLEGALVEIPGLGLRT